MTEKKVFRVIDGPLGIRDTPNGVRLKPQLADGALVEVDPASRQEAGGRVWWKHNAGWSAERAGSTIYMEDVTVLMSGETLVFEITDGPLGVREAANGKHLPIKLNRGTKVTVDPLSREERGGYVWWKHSQGWSAERNLTGNIVFMKLFVEGTSASAQSPSSPEAEPPLKVSQAPKRVEIPSHLKGKIVMQVAQDVKVRSAPSLKPNVWHINTIKRGATLECDFDELVEAEGYFWVKHKTGWSAWQTIDGMVVYLGEPGTIPGLIAIGEDGPKATDLPGYGSLIKHLPVQIEDVQWFQYFGNNVFGYVNGRSYGYDSYSQGLHGGLDFGNSARAGVKVYAGIEGTFVKAEYPSARNHRVLIQNGDYTFIYQHITNIRQFSPGQTITPDTELATIEHHSIGGWDHLHFEVRFMNDWIINPLLLFSPELYQTLTSRFDPQKPNTDWKKLSTVYNFFYKDNVWDRWFLPLDQPMLKLKGSLIGPRAKS